MRWGLRVRKFPKPDTQTTDIVVEQPVGDRYRYRTVCVADSELLIIELHTPLLLVLLDWHAVETLGGRAVDAKARLRLLADSVAAAGKWRGRRL